MTLSGQQIGRYHLLHLLGSGNMGEVYLAEDPQLNRQVAIKVINTETLSQYDTSSMSDASYLFLREARAIARLDHPHILPLFDYGEASINSRPFTYMVMPFRQEGSLATWLQQQGISGPISPKEVIHFVQQAADALQHAHDRLITHQDVKPSNFLVRNQQNNAGLPDILLADFGIAKLTTAATHASRTIRGTPTYMAPEQWNGIAAPASDQYALAVMAYQLLTGHFPFTGTIEQVMYQHIHADPPSPNLLNPMLPSAVDTVFRYALAKGPEDRFPSIQAFAQALQQALSNDPAYYESTVVRTPQTPIVLSTRPDPLTRTASTAHPKANEESLGRSFPKGLALVLVILAILISVGSAGFIYTNAANSRNSAKQAPVSAASSIATATPTVTPTEAPATHTLTPQERYTTAIGGNPVLDDGLDQQSPNKWYIGVGNNWSCAFRDGTYHASALQQNLRTSCMAQNSNFSNFAFQVQMMFVKGDAGGLIFRSDAPIANFYRFYFHSDGSYQLYVVVQNTTSQELAQGTASTNGSQPDTLTVVASGSDLYLYINKQFVTHVYNTTLNSGEIGVFCADINNPTEIAFSHAQVWQLAS